MTTVALVVAATAATAASVNAYYNLLKGVAGSAESVVLLGDLAIGTNPATAGVIRIPNALNLAARNAANSANIAIIGVDASDRVILDPSSNSVLIGSASASVVTLGGAAGGKYIAAGTITAGGLLASAVQVATSGPLIYSGSGAPSISAAVKGSLYLRTDGTGTADRIYVAKDTAGAWASLTAAS